MSKPKLFIGSSVEGLDVAYALQENLKFSSETTVWDQGVFNLSESSLESLLKMLDSCDFGVFVFSPDDHIKIRGKKDLAVRDNVLFELGLFVGKLGRKRSFIVIPDNKVFHLPTDLIGMTPATYEIGRTDNNMNAATGSASQKIREEITKQGAINFTEEAPELKTDDIQTKKNEKQEWFDYLYIDVNYDKAIQLLKKKVRYEKDIDEKVRLKGYICYAHFKKNPIEGTLEYEKLISDYSTNNVSYLAYADNLISTNAFKKALEVIELGLGNCVRKIVLTERKAKCLWSLGEKDDTIKLLNEALSNMSHELIALALANYYIELKEEKNAFEILRKAYFVHPLNEEILSKYAKLAYDVKEKEISILLYKELIALDVKNASYWALLGNTYYDFNFFNASLTAYQKAADLSNHKQSWIYGNIGNVFYAQGFYNQAQEYFKTALTLQAKSEYAHNRLSLIYTAIDEEQKKISDLLSVAKIKINQIVTE